MERITPQELQQEREAGNVFILDVRSPTAFQKAAEHIPGDVRFSPDELENWYTEVPKDRHVVTYCT